MNTDKVFRRALRRRIRLAGRDLALLPDALAEAALEALPAAEGAGLSVMADDMRIPLGASDDTSMRAEAIEMTVGDGPCLEAIRHGVLIDGSAAQLRRRWPTLHQAWNEQTPYRSALSVPVPLGIEVGCALNLYFTAEAGAPAIDLMPMATIGLLVADELYGFSAVKPAGLTTPLTAWLATPSARNRQRTWIAIGMVARAGRLNASDALALLRSRAFLLNRTMDELTHHITTTGDLTSFLAG